MIRNQALGKHILNIMETALELSAGLSDCLHQNQPDLFHKTAQELMNNLLMIQGISGQLKEEERALNLPAASASVLSSLQEIVNCSTADMHKALQKIENELIPLTEEMKINFFFWGTAYPDEAKMKHYYEQDRFRLFTNKHIVAGEAGGVYQYDVSIVITAFNKLEVTKLCIDSLMKYLPRTLNYELILVNHGSNDGTKEFFEQLKPDKQLDIAVNGGGSAAVNRIIEGKYAVCISNDIILTEHAIENLYQCIASDDSIAWVVPTTPNISNLQSIPADYNNLDGLFSFAAKNNQSDPTRWEQRVRLCNPMDIRRMSSFLDAGCFSYYVSTESMQFPDDKLSLLLRRKGYKLMLAKDAYCHHFGSITLKDEITQKNVYDFYLSGRKAFFDAFGVDPWGLGFCFDYPLFENFYFKKTGHIDIMGINCGLGSNSLKIKEALKETAKNTDVYLVNCTSDDRFVPDLRGISDEVILFTDWFTLFPPKQNAARYDYILVEDGLDGQENSHQIIEAILTALKSGGFFFARLRDQPLIDWIKTEYQNVQIIRSDTENDQWIVCAK
ncbi:MAG: glycosyltransferase [Lawsonibacter sp.]|nr:glycosyltransferase [Lawsonibacter sp.]